MIPNDVMITQLHYTHYVMRKNTEGITDDQALAQPSLGGNCMNWVVGHIISSRHGFLQVLGQEAVWDQETRKRYGRGSAAVEGPEEGLVPLSQMLEDLTTIQERTLAGLTALQVDRLSEKAPFSPANNPEETIGTLLAGLTFHESYHSGQTGMIRKLIGKLEGSLT